MDAKQELKREDNVKVDLTPAKEVKDVKQPDAAPPAPDTHNVIEKLSENLAKYVHEIDKDLIGKLGLEQMLKISPGQKILAIRQLLLPRIKGLEDWLESQAVQFKVSLQRDHKQKIARFLEAMCEIAEIN